MISDVNSIENIHFEDNDKVANASQEQGTKESFSKNRDNITILCSAQSESIGGIPGPVTAKTDNHKVWIYVKPSQSVEFRIHITVEDEKQSIWIVGIQLGNPEPEFVMNDHPYIFGNEPRVCEKNTSISIAFASEDIGHYETPVMLAFRNKDANKNIIFIRELVVVVEEYPDSHALIKSPYSGRKMVKAKCIIPSTRFGQQQKFKIPNILKKILPYGIGENALRGITSEDKAKARIALVQIRAIFEENITINNYMNLFHHLLWWEEVVVKNNLRKYNMPGVTIIQRSNVYLLEVPGLAEKRPSLIRGDRVYLQPHVNLTLMFECVISSIEDNYVVISNYDSQFDWFYKPDALFDVRFIVSRFLYELAHEAVFRIFHSEQDCRVFPEPNKNWVRVQPIERFFNPLIKCNEQQRCAVEHIISGTSGVAPYIVFGPPGTGKTMTIVEAIIQIAMRNKLNRLLVCTESNMAADNVAVMLLRFSKGFNINNFILRANARSRDWSSLPPELAAVSNGTSYETFVSLKNPYLAIHRIVVTTLVHAAKYAATKSQMQYKVQMSHLFIDEAGQASEPHSLISITGLLAPHGQLVLAGDPKQLGPLCFSKDAARWGLGTSLLERLHKNYKNLYEKDPNYMTMLKKNHRSHPDILKIPNKLFYQNELKSVAPFDLLSTQNILDLPGGDRAVVFHALNSNEERMGIIPSYFNEKELEMLKRYIKSLVEKHRVCPRDIGVIAPYIRQVYKMKAWLQSQRYNEIEVGTVESFQGKEKRVILMSTVRSNSKLLDNNPKFVLGFLVDEKRFNVAMTRAKAKLVIIGNPACLVKDKKWQMYMDLCKEYHSYLGLKNQQ